jgi:hypothetical protein
MVLNVRNYNVDVVFALGSSHRVNGDSTANVSEVHVVSIFWVEASSVNEC